VSFVVFLDSVGLLALWNAADQWHAAARRAFAPLAADRRYKFVSTSAVFLECGNAMARSPFRGQVVRTRAELAAAGRLFDPTPDEQDAARAAYDRGEAGGAGIVDHISFVVMRRLGITRAFTNDRQFAAAGFEPLF
jgi:predicted nucleic acid-binding protein